MSDPAKIKKRKPLWVRLLKIAGWTALGVVLLLILVSSMIVWLLTPERLTPLVQNQVNKMIDGEMKVERVELTFWHTFPRMTVDVDALEVVSHSLDNVADTVKNNLPSDADSLLYIGRFHGGLNVVDLMAGRITLYNVTVDKARLNVVVADAAHNNFDIFKSDNTEKSDTATAIPPFSIERFAIVDAAPIRFRSLSDSIDLTVDIKNIDIAGHDAPDYKLVFTGSGNTPLLRALNLDTLAVAVDGAVKWKPDNPEAITLKDFKVTLDSLSADFSTTLNFSDSLTVEKLDFKLEELRPAYLVKRVPGLDPKVYKTLDTDMKIDLSGKLTAPYVVGDTLHPIPSVEGQINVPACKFYFNGLRFNRFETDINYSVDGRDIDRSLIDVRKFVINGWIMNVDMKALVHHPMSDPAVEGKLKASFNLDRMPRHVWQRFASALQGKLSAELALKMRMSHLSANRFHNLKVTGDIDLDDFYMQSADSVMSFSTGHTCFKFGTNKTFVADDRPVVDSLLTMSLQSDSINFISGPVTVLIKDIKGGVGTRMTSERRDSTTVKPFGGVLGFKTVKIDDRSDSIRLRLTDVDCRASITRFEGNAKDPQLSLIFDARRITGAKNRDMAGLTGGHFDLSMHLRKSTRRQSGQLTDSARMARRRQASAQQSGDESANLDLEVDSGLRVLLNRWNLHGSVKAQNGRFRLSSLPVSNRIRNVDLRFNTDSLVLNDLYYKMGNSDFNVSGVISNLRRALTRKRNNTIRIDFDVMSDTIDVNNISRLLITDGAIAPDDDMPDLVNIENNVDYQLSDSAEHKAFVVPSNLAATLRIKARNVVYTDFILHNFHGAVLIANNAVNLRNLTASTEVGSLDISALYSAPDKKNIEFGLGMKINNFHLDKMMNLVPAIDSLMPVLRDFKGIINADIAATSKIDSTMNFEIPTLQAAIKLNGDSLVLLDADTFKSLSKWLMFKDKKHNMIDSMSVEMVVENSRLQIFPFIFNIDRYRLGVMGSNDMNMNLDYHVSVLKSPLPFKFGINIKGNIDNLKIRLGGAKFKNENMARSVYIADTTRINLVNQIENVFRRSARASLHLDRPSNTDKIDTGYEVLTAADSAMMIKEGLIEAPDTVVAPPAVKKKKLRR